MAEPKKKLSKTRTGSRRANYRVLLSSVMLCSNCHEPTPPHTVCPHCGYYKGQPVKKSLPTQRIVASEEKKEKKKS